MNNDTHKESPISFADLVSAVKASPALLSPLDAKQGDSQFTYVNLEDFGFDQAFMRMSRVGEEHEVQSVQRASFKGNSFKGMELKDVIFDTCDFIDLDFTDTLVSRCSFVNCRFVFSNLSHSRWRSVHLTDVYFTRSILDRFSIGDLDAEASSGKGNAFSRVRFVESRGSIVLSRIKFSEVTFSDSDFRGSLFTDLLTSHSGERLYFRNVDLSHSGFICTGKSPIYLFSSNLSSCTSVESSLILGEESVIEGFEMDDQPKIVSPCVGTPIYTKSR